MLSVPLLPVPSQSASIILDSQSVQFSVYQKLLGLYMDVYVDNVLIIGGVLCENTNRIVRSVYLGFTGDFMFFDNQGTDDPYYTGLGSRFSLIYLEAGDLPNGVG